MTVYIFRRIVGEEQQGWGVYRVDQNGRQALVEQFENAPQAKRHADEIRRMVTAN